MSGYVWLVVMDRGGLFGVWPDEARADEAARNVNGVLVRVPVVADYREPEPEAPMNRCNRVEAHEKHLWEYHEGPLGISRYQCYQCSGD